MPSIRQGHKAHKEISDELFRVVSERSDFSIRTYETERSFGWKAICLDCGREWGDFILKVGKLKSDSLLPGMAGHQIGISKVIWKHGNCLKEKK